MMNKTRDIIEGLVREGSFKWSSLSRRAASFDDELEDMSRSPSSRCKPIAELSSVANVIVARCSQILAVGMDDLQRNFDAQAPEPIKHPSSYARNFLEYCCFRTLALSSQVVGHLADKAFRRLSFDMMLAWEVPSVTTQPTVDRDGTVGAEAFSRIAPAVPTIADVITCVNLFDVLAASTGGRLTFSVYEKYLSGLDRAIKKMKTQSESSLHLSLRFPRGERILEVDGTLTTQPVLEHVGISTWPGRLTLTDHALYFEALRVVAFDKAKVYDLADDLKQIIKPELTGPWGSRIFDKAIIYKSTSLSDPVIMEFPELTGHSRRDYWLSIMREILYCHMFIRKFQIEDGEKEETLSKAVLGILRLQAIKELAPSVSVKYETVLTFNLCDELPGGDLILETLSTVIKSRSLDRTNHSSSGSGLYTVSAMGILSNLGVVSQSSSDKRLLVGEIIVGEMTLLEKAINESRNNYKKVEQAQATVDGVKVDGLGTNFAVMKELLLPVTEIGNQIISLASWDEPLKSLVFCCISCYIIVRGWFGYVFVISLLLTAAFMLLTRCCSRGRPIDQIKVKAPPSMNTMEQLLAVQNAISQVEELVQDGNVILLKLRALLLALPSQATDRTILALILMALAIAFLPVKLMSFGLFLEIFTRNSPPRRPSTERWTRRLREWWFSIPAAPVVLERDNEEKKKR